MCELFSSLYFVLMILFPPRDLLIITIPACHVSPYLSLFSSLMTYLYSLRMRALIRQSPTRSGWRTATLSPRHHYILALSLASPSHSVEVWDTRTANIVKVFQGPSEGSYDLAQHPYLPLATSVTAAGSLVLMSRPSTERWSAFVPDFEEMSNNQEYRVRVYPQSISS